jgi:hypothetical protein
MHGPPRLSSQQCVLTVREDFLGIEGNASSAILVSDLYLQLAGLEKDEATFVVLAGGRAYLAGMTFAGNLDSVRAIDVQESTQVYVSGTHEQRQDSATDVAGSMCRELASGDVQCCTCMRHCGRSARSLAAGACSVTALRHMHAERDTAAAHADSVLTHLDKDQNTAVRVAAGASATVARCTFANNNAFTTDDDKDAGGPALGLLSGGGGGNGAADAWALLQACTFANNTAGVGGDVMVETSKCRVYTMAAEPREVFSGETDTLIEPWWVRDSAEKCAHWPPKAGGKLRGRVFDGRTLLRPDDAWLQAATRDQARVSGLPQVACPAMPPVSRLIVRDPLGTGPPTAAATAPSPQPGALAPGAPAQSARVRPGAPTATARRDASARGAAPTPAPRASSAVDGSANERRHARIVVLAAAVASPIGALTLALLVWMLYKRPFWTHSTHRSSQGALEHGGTVRACCMHLLCVRSVPALAPAVPPWSVSTLQVG